MRTKLTTNPVIDSGDLFQVFVKHRHEKRGKWMSPRVVSQVDNSFATMFVPGTNDHKRIPVLKDTRVEFDDD